MKHSKLFLTGLAFIAMSFISYSQVAHSEEVDPNPVIRVKKPSTPITPSTTEGVVQVQAVQPQLIKDAPVKVEEASMITSTDPKNGGVLPQNGSASVNVTLPATGGVYFHIKASQSPQTIVQGVPNGTNNYQIPSSALSSADCYEITVTNAAGIPMPSATPDAPNPFSFSSGGWSGGECKTALTSASMMAPPGNTPVPAMEPSPMR